jgi:hypothetical protein
VLITIGVVLLVVALCHLSMLFLRIAPDNSVSTKYEEQIDDYVYPDFRQSWRMFAPNPGHQEIEVEARARMTEGLGADRTTSWVNISAQDAAAVRHNPVPSKFHQAMLRKALEFYLKSPRDRDGRPKGVRGDLSSVHIKRIALQRIGMQESSSRRPVSIQFRVTKVPVQPPEWDAEKDREETVSQTLAWWPVEEADLRGL